VLCIWFMSHVFDAFPQLSRPDLALASEAEGDTVSKDASNSLKRRTRRQPCSTPAHTHIRTLTLKVSCNLVHCCQSDRHTAQPLPPSYRQHSCKVLTMSCISFRQTSFKQGTARPAPRRAVRVTAVHQPNKPVAGFVAAAAAAVLLVS
jgi:hypothetical protein